MSTVQFTPSADQAATIAAEIRVQWPNWPPGSMAASRRPSSSLPPPQLWFRPTAISIGWSIASLTPWAPTWSMVSAIHAPARIMARMVRPASSASIAWRPTSIKPRSSAGLSLPPLASHNPEILERYPICHWWADSPSSAASWVSINSGLGLFATTLRLCRVTPLTITATKRLGLMSTPNPGPPYQ